MHLKSGVVDNLAENEEDALDQIKTFLSLFINYLFLNNKLKMNNKIRNTTINKKITKTHQCPTNI